MAGQVPNDEEIRQISRLIAARCKPHCDRVREIFKIRETDPNTNRSLDWGQIRPMIDQAMVDLIQSSVEELQRILEQTIEELKDSE